LTAGEVTVWLVGSGRRAHFAGVPCLHAAPLAGSESGGAEEWYAEDPMKAWAENLLGPGVQ
jgi:hypothetical protein